MQDIEKLRKYLTRKRPRCLCTGYMLDSSGEEVKYAETCRKDELLKCINNALVHGWDECYLCDLADATVNVWVKNKNGELESFEIDPDTLYLIFSGSKGSDELRKEIRKEFLEFKKKGKIVGIYIGGAFGECCYGTDEICDFAGMLEGVKKVLKKQKQ